MKCLLLGFLVLASFAFSQPILIGPYETESMDRDTKQSDSADSSKSKISPADSGKAKPVDKLESDHTKGNKRLLNIGLYDPTYFSFAPRSDYDLPDSNMNRLDPPHIEFLVSPHYSVRLFPKSIDSLRFLGIYRGLYNFYFGSEHSGPVISRMQNLDFFFEYQFDYKAQGAIADFFRHLRLQFGGGHESNGMFVDNRPQNAQMIDALPHRPQNEGPMNPQDFASMGWNYWKVTLTRRYGLPKGYGALSLNGSFKYFVNQDFTGMWNFRDTKLEDTAFYFDLRDKPGIARYAGINLGANYFNSFSESSIMTKLFFKSLFLSYQGRMGYQKPYNGSGSLMLAGNVTTLKWLPIGLNKGLEYLGSDGFELKKPWFWLPNLLAGAIDGFHASLPLFVKWDCGYSENLAYYPIQYSGIGKISFGGILMDGLMNSQ